MQFEDMSVKELKQYAIEFGIEFHTSYSKKKMLEVLAVNKLVPDKPLYDGPPSSTNIPAAQVDEPINIPKHDYTQEIKKAVFMYKNAQSAVELRFAKQELTVLKNKIKESKDELALRKILGWERSRKIISVVDEYFLNSLEVQDPKLELCLHHQKISGSGLHVQLGNEYKFKRQYDEQRGCEMFTFYVDRTIKRDEQIGTDLAWKMANGFMPDQKDFPPEKTVYHRFQLAEKEFKKYFQVIGEESLDLSM